ncbi:MAG: tRNA 2-thiouridine(34) synthase MnmA, partial [Patescibacteria group bacterium]
ILILIAVTSNLTNVTKIFKSVIKSIKSFVSTSLGRNEKKLSFRSSLVEVKTTMKEEKKKVFVAMSGGVDSSVAALLLSAGSGSAYGGRDQGYDVTGIFMRCYNLDGCAEADAEDARRVAERLGIPFYVWDFEEEYKREVVNYMVDGYKRGITPNPDVMCNKKIKFGLFLKKALELGADYIATGHYVRLERKFPISNFQFTNKLQIQNSENSNIKNSLKIENYKLKIAKDTNKDQSYFLWTLTQEQLKYCLFPIGDYLKSEVREIARKAGLPTADKKDSQGICFLGKVTLDAFLKSYIPEKRGEVLNMRGKKIGEHNGAHFYTIGQRRGIGNIKHEKGNTIHEPVYVTEKNINLNTVTVARGEENPALYRQELELTNINVINPDVEDRLIRANKRIVENGIKILARVRYRQPLAKAELTFSNSRELENGKMRLIFDEPQKFVASGQSAVFYLPSEALTKEGDGKLEMFGGGVII